MQCITILLYSLKITFSYFFTESNVLLLFLTWAGLACLFFLSGFNLSPVLDCSIIVCEEKKVQQSAIKTNCFHPF